MTLTDNNISRLRISPNIATVLVQLRPVLRIRFERVEIVLVATLVINRFCYPLANDSYRFQECNFNL